MEKSRQTYKWTMRSRKGGERGVGGYREGIKRRDEKTSVRGNGTRMHVIRAKQRKKKKQKTPRGMDPWMTLP